MEKFDLFKIDPKLQQEIQACQNAEDLKALFAAKSIEVPDNKLEAIMKLSEKITELNQEDLMLLSGGCKPDPPDPCPTTCPGISQCTMYNPCDIDNPF